MANLKELLATPRLEKKEVEISEGVTANIYLKELSYDATATITELGKGKAKEANLIMVSEMARDESGAQIFSVDELKQVDTTIFLKLLEICSGFTQKKMIAKKRTSGTN